MRLGQLARQLEKQPDKIVTFLAQEKNVTIKSHPNCKVEDELIEAISNHFKPATEEVDEATATPKEKKAEPKTEETTTVEETPAPVEHIETQKAPEAQELKIIGKIDLPNKKEIEVEVDGVVYDQATLDEKKKEELKADREQKAIEKEPTFELNYIVMSAGQKRASVNGKKVHEGDMVSGAKITRITSDSVHLSYKGQPKKLRMNTVNGIKRN